LTDFTVNNEKYEAVRIMNKDQSCSNDLENYLFERLKNKINKLRTHKSKVHLVCFDYVENIFSDISPR
jgi:hypothetical protein